MDTTRSTRGCCEREAFYLVKRDIHPAPIDTFVHFYLWRTTTSEGPLVFSNDVKKVVK